jgi:hypothetical protein
MVGHLHKPIIIVESNVIGDKPHRIIGESETLMWTYGVAVTKDCKNALLTAATVREHPDWFVRDGVLRSDIVNIIGEFAHTHPPANTVPIGTKIFPIDGN